MNGAKAQIPPPSSSPPPSPRETAPIGPRRAATCPLPAGRAPGGRWQKTKPAGSCSSAAEQSQRLRVPESCAALAGAEPRGAPFGSGVLPGSYLKTRERARRVGGRRYSYASARDIGWENAKYVLSTAESLDYPRCHFLLRTLSQ